MQTRVRTSPVSSCRRCPGDEPSPYFSNAPLVPLCPNERAFTHRSSKLTSPWLSGQQLCCRLAPTPHCSLFSGYPKTSPWLFPHKLSLPSSKSCPSISKHAPSAHPPPIPSVVSDSHPLPASSARTRTSCHERARPWPFLFFYPWTRTVSERHRHWRDHLGGRPDRGYSSRQIRVGPPQIAAARGECGSEDAALQGSMTPYAWSRLQHGWWRCRLAEQRHQLGGKQISLLGAFALPSW